MILIIFVCFFLFLFITYYLGRDDFVLTRKDILVSKVFSLAVLTGLIALFSARFVFVLSYPTSVLLNPLGFLAFYYYAGLSLVGAMVGSEIFIYAYCKYKKMPAGKIFDLFTLSWIVCKYIVGFLNYFINYLW